MENLHRGYGSSGRALRQPSAGVQPPPQLALQIDAAVTLPGLRSRSTPRTQEESWDA